MGMSKLSEPGGGYLWDIPCPFSARSRSSPPLSEQLYLMASCVLISMGDHCAWLINTSPVND